MRKCLDCSTLQPDEFEVAARMDWPATLRRAIRAEARVQALRDAIEELLWRRTEGRCRLCGQHRPIHDERCPAVPLHGVWARDESETRFLDEFARKSQRIRELESEARKLEDRECLSCSGLGVVHCEPDGIVTCQQCNGHGRIWRQSAAL